MGYFLSIFGLSDILYIQINIIRFKFTQQMHYESTYMCVYIGHTNVLGDPPVISLLSYTIDIGLARCLNHPYPVT